MNNSRPVTARRSLRTLWCLLLSGLSCGIQAAEVGSAQANGNLSGAGHDLFHDHCAGCHEGGVPKAPHTEYLRMMSAQAIYKALTEGAMKIQGQSLGDGDKRLVAEYLTGRSVDAA